MKIVFVIDQVYLHGGIERVLSIKANFYSENSNNEIFIITTEQKNNPSCFDFNEDIIFKDLKINYERNRSYFHPKNLIKLPAHILRVRKALKKIKPDVVVVCSHSTDTFFMPFINRKIPKIKEFHFSKFIEENVRKSSKLTFKKLFFKFTDYVEHKYDRLIVLNKDEAKYYKSNNTTVIANPLTFYPENIAKLTNNIIIAAGRIAPVKGYDILIDIWSLVNHKLNNWELHIYGDGEQDYFKSLQNKIDNLKLNSSLKLKGATNNIKSKMLEASLFVMTSHNECFPLVLLEAQACGLPILAFDCPHGPRNIVNRETGVLVEHYNNEAFANCLVRVTSDSVLINHMGEKAREHALKFKLETIMGRWDDMFVKVINEKNEKYN